MTSIAPPAQCLATVTSDGFALGTLVAAHSFRTINPWFDGDILIIADGLSDANRALLDGCLPSIRWIEPDRALVQRIDALVAARPELAGRRSRLLSLQALQLRGYDKLLFCDSDTVFTGDMAALFATPGSLIACPDSAMLQGGGRAADSFASIAGGTAGLASFNAGMLVIDRAITAGPAYDDALALVAPESWDGVVTDHTDQLLLNRLFADRVTLAPARYNLMLLHRALSAEAAGTRIDEAAMLHFNGPAKPWDSAAMVRAIRRDPALLPAWRCWQDALADALVQMHLRPARREVARPNR